MQVRLPPVTGGPHEPVPFGEAVRAWARVAANSFGGPAGQIGVIHRVVVEEKGWLDEPRFLHALSYCMLLPGPEAQQLATYVGWLLHGVRGGVVAGALFVLPGFLSILLLSVLYAGYRDLGLVAGLFVGLKPAVLAIVFEAVLRLRRRALTGRASTVIAVLAFLAMFAFGVPFPLVVLAAGVAGFVVHQARRPAPSRPATRGASGLPGPARVAATAALWLGLWLVPLAVLRGVLGPRHVLVLEGVFFSKAAVVTFGGAYAVLTYVAHQAVETYQWLVPGQMLDGLGMAETTPGPLIQVVQFVGFMGALRSPGALDPVLAGIAGSVVTTWVTFVPCFFFVFVGAPFVESLREHRQLTAVLGGITAAVVGVVLNLAVWFALHTLFRDVGRIDWGPFHLAVPRLTTLDAAALVIAVGALVAVFRYRAGMMRTLAGAAVAGVLLHVLL